MIYHVIVERTTVYALEATSEEDAIDKFLADPDAAREVESETNEINAEPQP